MTNTAVAPLPFTARFRVPVADRPAFEAVVITVAASVGQDTRIGYNDHGFAFLALGAWPMAADDKLMVALWKADQARPVPSGWVL